MWRITLVMDLLHYQNVLDQSLKNLGEIKKFMQSRKDFFQVQEFESHFKTLESELSLLVKSRQKIVNSFSQLKTLHSRSKRSIFPFLGDVISFIAGTPSERELNDIRGSVKTLSDNQKKVQHVVKQSLSLINMTHDRVVENRKKINEIGSGMEELMAVVEGINRELQLESKENRSWKIFLNFYLQVRSILNNAGEVIMELNFYLEELQVQLNMLSMGKIAPITIKPEELRHTLLAIQNKLPENLRLPFNPKANIWNYYRTLTSSVIFDDNKILVVINVPLVDRGTQFEVFTVHNMPIPNVLIQPKEVSELSLKKRHLVANYDLEAKALAINRQRTNYIMLTDDEAKQCANPLVSFCEFKSPIYPVNWSKFCLIALFMGSDERIKKLCQAKVFVNEILPIAEYISEGLWLITTAERLSFTKTCRENPADSGTFNVEPPMAFVRLNETCSASNNHLTLQPFYRFRSQVSLEVGYKLEGDILKGLNFTDIKLWEPINRIIPKVNFSHHYKELPKIEDMKMENLVNEINSLEEVYIQQESFWKRYKFLIIGAIIVLILTILIFIKYKFSKKGLRFWSRKLGSSYCDSSIDSPTDETGGPSRRVRRVTKLRTNPTNHKNDNKHKRKSTLDLTDILLAKPTTDNEDNIRPPPPKMPRLDLTVGQQTDQQPLKHMLP